MPQDWDRILENSQTLIMIDAEKTCSKRPLGLFVRHSNIMTLPRASYLLTTDIAQYLL